jgi:thiaminase/transcriptional activator TenA
VTGTSFSAELELHAGLLDDLGIDAGAIDAAGAGPTTTAYTSYLIAVAVTGLRRRRRGGHRPAR